MKLAACNRQIASLNDEDLHTLGGGKWQWSDGRTGRSRSLEKPWLDLELFKMSLVYLTEMKPT